MGDSVRRIITEILPIFFSKLKYDPNEMVHLITFSDDADYYKMKVSDFKTLTNFYQGNTYMLPAVKKFNELVNTFKVENIEALRILTISDGIIFDQDTTSAAAETIAALVQTFSVAINSQAVRWQEPTADTRALSCLLQMNNVKLAYMVDSKRYQQTEVIADEWAKLFMRDELVGFQSIESPEPVFLRNPWDTMPLAKIRVTKGRNTVFLTKIPVNMTIGEEKVNVKQLTTLSNYRLHELMRNKYETIVEKVKLLKIINSASSRTAADNIVDYFKAVDDEVPMDEDSRSFYFVVKKVARDNSTARMSMSQLAEYLKDRKVEVDAPPYVPDEDEDDDEDDDDEVLVDEVESEEEEEEETDEEKAIKALLETLRKIYADQLRF
jgi:hypothetical protein